MITIVDYEMGNIGSVQNMFKHIGVECFVTNKVNDIKNADKLLLPGVGAFDKAMSNINDKGLKEVITYKALVDKTPILGICLGMQLLTNESEEGILPGLGLISAKTLKFKEIGGLKIPHMGWNGVYKSNESVLTKNLTELSKFYFVHSFYVKVSNEKNSILKTNYSVEFDSAIQSGNIYGAQFHPEKSHKFGMQLLDNFARI